MALRPPAVLGIWEGVAALASDFDPFLAGFSQGIEERTWIWRGGGEGEWPGSGGDPGWTSSGFPG